jgi:Methyltransferase domain
MPSEISRAVTKLAYGATQVPRVAWYIGHSLVLRELANTISEREKPKAGRHMRAVRSVPDRRRIYMDMAKLFLQDLSNVEAGIYPLPADRDGPFFASIRRSQLFFEDLPSIHQRRKRRAHDEVLNDATRGKRPRYYLQNFHYQSGWMTDNSAELYDTQVEVLFNGSANAIRRQALPQLHEVFAGRDQRKLSLMDVGCGTGRFFDSVKQVWPRLPTFGIDMSEAYVKYAKRHLKHWSQIKLSVGRRRRYPFRTRARTR